MSQLLPQLGPELLLTGFACILFLLGCSKHTISRRTAPFVALELVSIPTYIMVSISRPRAVAQEAGVKYFFLGAMSVALMLFGFSYLFGATGQIKLPRIGAILQQTISQTGNLAPWQKLGVL